ncbi:MAG: tRNA (adenosine(37)-N6)-threonylcarbamoyltransferase complex ATPase subunit type 1 TsaE [Clostridia bacterium]|nr:tRNA (adenosine(37)-N6)-threonylcarbamoyltransferase complex ATPase subunit type 1 TsaE [Clostridia bacterium]
MKTFITNSPEETEAVALKLSDVLCGGEVIAFRGDLGAGKTCFTRGLAKGLGYNGNVTSPTFAIVNEYLGGKFNIYHYDMYRIEGWEDLYSTGFFDYKDLGGIIVAEWSENIEGALDNDTIYVLIDKLGDNQRKITISGVDLP